MSRGRYIDYVSHCIISGNGKPLYSLCCDAKDVKAQITLLALLDLNVFAEIGLAIADKISIIASHKASCLESESIEDDEDFDKL